MWVAPPGGVAGPTGEGRARCLTAPSANCTVSVGRVSHADARGPGAPDARRSFSVRPVSDDQWEIVAWLWQAFRHDLATIVNGLPYADGRYQARQLERLPSADAAGYLAWRPHPKTGEDAPVAFAVIDGLAGDRRSVLAFWVAPAARREGIGRRFAADVLSRHDGPWSVAFQHENASAGRFWREIADTAFGPGQWSEELRPVPGRPHVPPDHFIESGPRPSRAD
jgi:GNAT superfamily N-acetyltransferase